MARKPIDVEELRKTFRIKDGKIEKLYVKNKGKGIGWLCANKSKNKKGYSQVCFNRKMISYQNILWILTNGKDIPKGFEIDHINGNRSDNRIENLRLVTRRENNQNKKKHREGGLVGSTYDKVNKKYRCQIQIGKRQISIGRYDTEQEAHTVYTIACENIAQYIDNDSFRRLVRKQTDKHCVSNINN